eukprot:1109259-Rhodomonas_salina.1
MDGYGQSLLETVGNTRGAAAAVGQTGPAGRLRARNGWRKKHHMDPGPAERPKSNAFAYSLYQEGRGLSLISRCSATAVCPYRTRRSARVGR